MTQRHGSYADDDRVATVEALDDASTSCPRCPFQRFVPANACCGRYAQLLREGIREMTQPDESIARVVLEELTRTSAMVQEFTRSHDDYVESCVRVLRSAGATWRDVGEALGSSRQAAWERFAHLDGMGE